MFNRIRTTLPQHIKNLSKTPPPPKESLLVSFKTGNMTLQATTPFAKGSFHHRMHALKLGVGVTLFGLGSALWIKDKSCLLLKTAHQDGLFDINALTLRDWMAENNPTAKEMAGACAQAIEDNHPRCVQILLQTQSFSQEELEQFFMQAIQHNRPECLNLILESKNLSSIPSELEKRALDYVLEHDLSNCLEVLLGSAEKGKFSIDLTTESMIHWARQITPTPTEALQLLQNRIKDLYALAKKLPPAVQKTVLSILEVLSSIYGFATNTAPNALFSTAKFGTETLSFTGKLAYTLCDIYLELIQTALSTVHDATPKTSEEWMEILKNGMQSARKEATELLCEIEASLKQKASNSVESVINAPRNFIHSLQAIDLTPSDRSKSILTSVLLGKCQHKETSIDLGKSLGEKTITFVQAVSATYDSFIEFYQKMKTRLHSIANKEKEAVSSEETKDSPPVPGSIEAAILQMIQNNTTYEENSPLSIEEKKQLTVRELAKYKSPKCLSILDREHHTKTTSSHDLLISMKTAMSHNNTEHVKILLKSLYARNLEAKDLKEAMNQGIESNSIESIQFLLSKYHFSDDDVGEMLTLSARSGNSKMVSVFLSFGYRIPENHFKEALFEAIKWPRYELFNAILSSPHFTKDEKLISSVFQGLIKEGYSYILDEFLKSSYATFLSKEEKKAFTDSLKSAAERLSHLNTVSFADPDYAKEALLSLSAHSTAQNLKELLNLKEYEDTPAELLVQAIDAARSSSKEENVQAIFHSPAYKKLFPEEFVKIGRSDVLCTPTIVIPQGPSLWQRALSATYSIWEQFRDDRNKPKFTPATDKEVPFNE